MFLLHDMHACDHNNIRKMRGCSVGHSKSQVHQAVGRLREELRDRDSGSQ
jgi:RNA polymerase sigma-70 factor (ECF subfamily)